VIDTERLYDDRAAYARRAKIAEAKLRRIEELCDEEWIFVEMFEKPKAKVVRVDRLRAILDGGEQ